MRQYRKEILQQPFRCKKIVCWGVKVINVFKLILSKVFLWYVKLFEIYLERLKTLTGSDRTVGSLRWFIDVSQMIVMWQYIERNTSTMVQMHEDNIFQQKMLFSNLLFANGVVTCGVVMKFEWELKCKQMSAVVSCCLE